MAFCDQMGNNGVDENTHFLLKEVFSLNILGTFVVVVIIVHKINVVGKCPTYNSNRYYEK